MLSLTENTQRYKSLVGFILYRTEHSEVYRNRARQGYIAFALRIYRLTKKEGSGSKLFPRLPPLCKGRWLAVGKTEGLFLILRLKQINQPLIKSKSRLTFLFRLRKNTVRLVGQLFF